LEWIYVIEPLFWTQKGDDKTPDVVGSGLSGWFVIEITTQLGSKEPNLESYLSIDPRYLAQHGLQPQDAPPDVFSRRLSFVNDGPYCQLIVRDHLEILKEERIKNQKLKAELIKSHGADLIMLPNIPITLLPEMRPHEIRRGLIEIVMQLFSPESKGKSLVQIVDEGLERLSEKIVVSAKSRLRDSVKREMEDLIKHHLKDYILFNEEEGAYRSTEKFKQNPKTMEKITFALTDWAGIGPQKTLDIWISRQ
jgi:hypothetical protein